ncbi:MAG: PAC2 family protein [Acidimicrobiales bacterium]
MEHVAWSERPRLRTPVLIAAFEGWNDAGEAASYAARYLAEQWVTRRFAVIDPEEFFDFSSTRPHVGLDGGLQREIEWPSTEFTGGAIPGAAFDAVILLGSEPQLRWRTFCQQIVDVARDVEARLVITLGALLAEVPHSRPVSIVGTADDDDLVRRLDLQHSTYQGPTGIVGVLHDACRKAGIPSASLWAAVPTYVPGAPSPKAALALVERVAAMLTLPIPVTALEIASAAYERQLDELVADDDDTATYVANLEAGVDEDEAVIIDGVDGVDGVDLISEVEDFLRDNPGA